MAKPLTYNADSIEVHLGLDAVRANINVYAGNPDSDGMLHIVKEVIDNSNDEAKAGHGKYFGVSVTADGYIWVYDDGRGIPIETHKTSKISTLTTVLTMLSAGGKMGAENSGYGKGTVGVHGMGAAVTNAVCEVFNAYVYRDGWYKQEFSKGKETTKVVKCKAPVIPNAPPELATRKRGTTICLKPDMTIFDKGSKLSTKGLENLLNLIAYLNPKVTIYLSTKDKQKTYHHPDGLKSLVEKHMARKETEALGKAFEYESGDISMYLQWTHFDEESIVSFVNGSHTSEHGTHVLGLNRAIGQALDSFKTAKSKFKTEDLRVGLFGVFNYNLLKPRFSGQTKGKLVTPEATEAVQSQLVAALKTFFDANKTLVKSIIKRAEDIRALFEDFKLGKAATAELKTTIKGRSMLPDKLTVSLTKNPNERELFLVEGDSAEGPCKQARFKQFQEVLPLKGKMKNVFKAKVETVMLSEEIIKILKAIGYDPSKKDPYSSLRVGKLIILSDADPDGAHITILLSGVAYKFLKPLVDAGNLYVAHAPLFYVKVGAKSFYGMTKEIVKGQMPANNNTPILRMKGLGEAPISLLNETVFDVKKRILSRLVAVTGKDELRYVSMLDEDTSARKTLLGL